MFFSDRSSHSPHSKENMPTLSHLNDFSFLSSCEEEFELVRQWKEKGDKKAVRRLISSHKKLVEKIAYGYKGYGLCIEELISEGYVGMMQAVEKFDPDKGFRLSTYSAWWIKAAIQDYIFNSWSLVKFSKSKSSRKLFFGLRKYKNDKGYDDHLTPEQAQDIATHMDVSVKEVYEMDQRLRGSDHSLNASVSYSEDSDTEWQDWIPDTKQNIEENTSNNDEATKIQKIIHHALKVLSPREHRVLILRRFKEPAETLETIAEELSISKERVRQIENAAYDKLHDEIKKSVSHSHFFALS